MDVINGVNIYIKNDHCEDSLKDLCRKAKQDRSDRPYCRIILAKCKHIYIRGNI
jgi:hypothetical protein